MRSTTSVYYVECLEQGKVKIVPHEPGGKTYEYMSRKSAVDFMAGFVVCNPQWKIRLCKRTTTETEGPWLSKYK